MFKLIFMDKILINVIIKLIIDKFIIMSVKLIFLWSLILIYGGFVVFVILDLIFGFCCSPGFTKRKKK